jgi:hypothetical protein
MSYTIKSKSIGRLKSKTDYSQGIETDLSLFPTYIPVILVEYNETDTKYAVIIKGFTNDFENERIVTQIEHNFVLAFVTDKWVKVEMKDIDNAKFPNLNSIVADNVNSYIDTLTGIIYDKSDSEIWEDDLQNEVLDEQGNSFNPKKYQQKIKDTCLPYYYAISVGNAGTEIFGMLTNDIYNRF